MRSPAKGIIAHNLRRIEKGTLIGAVDLTVPGWHLTFCGCLWHRNGESEWVAFPGREWRGRDGSVQYANLIKFTDPATRDRFREAALKAVRELAAKSGASPTGGSGKLEPGVAA